jgi:hypothetical protein
MRAAIAQFGLLTVGLMLMGAILPAGCAEQGRGLFTGPIPIIEEFPVYYNKTGKYCGAKGPLRLVVRDQGHMAFVPVSDVPVDFDREMVLFVTMGQVYSDAYDIRIDRVWRQNQIVKVAITVTHPEPGEMGAPQPCSPYHLVVVPKSSLNVDGFVTEITPPSLEHPGMLPAPPKKNRLDQEKPPARR